MAFVDFYVVPGSSQKMLSKSRGLTVDCVAYDLEDSVTPGKKAEARSNIRQFLDQPRAANIREQAVRINAVETGLALDDLTEVVSDIETQHLLWAPQCSCSEAQSTQRRRHSDTQGELGV